MPSKTITIAAAFAATAFGSAGLMVGYANWAVRGEVARFVKAHDGVTIGGVDVDAFGRRVTLRNVAVTTGSLRVYARTLSLPVTVPDIDLVGSAEAGTSADHPLRLAQWPVTEPKKPEAVGGSGIGFELKIPGQSAAPAAPTSAAPPPSAPPVATNSTSGSASASDVTIVNGTTTYTIKKIDLTGTTLSNADLTALLDPKSPETIAVRLKKLNAASIVIPEIVSENQAADHKARATFSQLLFANVVGGRIGMASIAGTTLTGLNPKDDLSIKTGAILASGLDLALIAHMVDAVRTDDAEPLKTLSESLTINDIVWNAPEKGNGMSIAKISQKDLKARPLKTDLQKLNTATDKDAPGDETAKTERSKAVADDISSSFEVGAFAIDKIAASSNEAKKEFKLKIDKIGLDSYVARKLTAFTIRDVAFDGQGTKLSFATLDLTNIVVPPTKKAGAADPSTAMATDSIPTIGKADLGQFDFDTSTPQEDGTTSKVKFKVAHFGATSDQIPGGLPSQGVLAIDNLTFDVPDSQASGAKEFYAMGYRQMDLSGAFATAYDQKLETLSIQKFLVSGVGMGSVNLAVDLGNVSKGIMSANPSVAKASALSMLLKRVDIRLENSGLFEKALDWKAKQDGKTVADERNAGIDLFAAKLPEMLGNGPGIKAIGAAVAKFIADPKSLHIAAASKDGLGASDMGLIGAPDELLSHLDIQAEANQ